jgi:hypothetical protein
VHDGFDDHGSASLPDRGSLLGEGAQSFLEVFGGHDRCGVFHLVFPSVGFGPVIGVLDDLFAGPHCQWSGRQDVLGEFERAG